MKKLLYTLLAVLIIFSACEKEEESSSNNNSNNNTTGTIADIVGVWQLEGFYDASDNLINDAFNNTDQENCMLQSNIILQSDGNAINQWYYLQNEIDGPCIYESMAFSFQYINSTTLNFLTTNSCGNSVVATIINNTQLRGPICNGDDGTYDGSYMLYEKQ